MLFTEPAELVELRRSVTLQLIDAALELSAEPLLAVRADAWIVEELEASKSARSHLPLSVSCAALEVSPLTTVATMPETLTLDALDASISIFAAFAPSIVIVEPLDESRSRSLVTLTFSSQMDEPELDDRSRSPLTLSPLAVKLEPDDVSTSCSALDEM